MPNRDEREGEAARSEGKSAHRPVAIFAPRDPSKLDRNLNPACRINTDTILDRYAIDIDVHRFRHQHRVIWQMVKQFRLLCRG